MLSPFCVFVMKKYVTPWFTIDWEVDTLAPLLSSLELKKDLFLILLPIKNSNLSLLRSILAHPFSKLIFPPVILIWISLPKRFENPKFPRGYGLSYCLPWSTVSILRIFSNEESYLWPSHFIGVSFLSKIENQKTIFSSIADLPMLFEVISFSKWTVIGLWPEDLKDFIFQWFSEGRDSTGKAFWDCLLHANFFGIW